MQGKTQDEFVSLDKALLVIAEALYGEEASLPEKGTEEFREVWTIFRRALANNNVKAFWFDNQMKDHPFTKQWAAADFFCMDSHNHKLAHLSGPGPVLLKVHVEDLKNYLAERGIYTPKIIASAEDKCREWLEDLFRSEAKVLPKDRLYQEMKNRFPRLSALAFGRARKAAIKATGRTDLERAGRPRVISTNESR